MEKLTAIELSQYILAKLGTMSHLKLQKLIYYVEAYHLAYFEESIIDEGFQAWVHGPVVREVWDNYKNLDSPLFDKISLSSDEKKEIVQLVERRLSEDQLSLIGDVFEALGSTTAYDLERLTHQEEPWREARQGLPIDENCTKTISRETMRRFYYNEMYSLE